MSKGWISRLLGPGAEELSLSAARESVSQLRVPTLDERVGLYSRAVGQTYSVARNRILDAMAADIAIKAAINLPEELERPGVPQGAKPDETAWAGESLEYQYRYAPDAMSTPASEPFELSERFEYSADFLTDRSVAAFATETAEPKIEPSRSPRRIEPGKRPALKLAMLAASLCAVAVIGASVTFLALREFGVVPKSDKFDVAIQSLQKPSSASPQAEALNELNRPQAMASVNAPAVVPMATSPIAAAMAPVLPPTPKEIADLVKRGRELFAAGKIRDARLLLKRAADASDASAAFALGTTYDPAELKKLGIGNSDSDITMARAWYQKAKDLGLTEAGGILQNSDR
jgi:TPR repeat protein